VETEEGEQHLRERHSRERDDKGGAAGAVRGVLRGASNMATPNEKGRRISRSKECKRKERQRDQNRKEEGFALTIAQTSS